MMARAEVPAPDSPDQIAQIVDEMSIDDLIGQMTWTHVYGNSANDSSMASQNQAVFGDDVSTPAQAIAKYNLGGVLYFAWSNPVVTDDPTGTARLSNEIQQTSIGQDASGIPLAITIDQEGGLVARMGEPMTVFPNAMALGATGSVELAREQGRILAEELSAVGVNVDFAPVVDVNTNPDNPVIGVRSLGEDPAAVATLSSALIEGMQSNGIGATAKHFPGHGDTAVDSHTGLPVIDYDRATLDQHLIPFEAAIEKDVDIIMSAHIVVKILDDQMPGTLSPAVMTDLLRNELGHDGLITTDAIDMQALRELPGNPLTEEQIAVLAVQAGSDILLNSTHIEQNFQGIRDAVASGEITRERLEESVTRILKWKLQRGIWADPMVDPEAALTSVGTAENQAVADEIARKAVTVVHNDGGALPLAPQAKILLVGRSNSSPVASELSARDYSVTSHFQAEDQAYDQYIDQAVEMAADHDLIVVTTYNATASKDQQALISALVDTGKKVVVVATRNPYDASVADGAAAVVNTYGFDTINWRALADVISGDEEPAGTLPVSIPNAQDPTEVLYPIGSGITTWRTAPKVSISVHHTKTRPVGVGTNVWGTIIGSQAGDKVVTQVKVNGRWSQSQAGTVDDHGFYALPLTYGQNTAGSYEYRVVTVTRDGVAHASEPFQYLRTTGVTTRTVGEKPVSETTFVWGNAYGAAPGDKIVTQVRLNGTWVQSQARSVKTSTGYYEIPLTYGYDTAGSYRFRVVAVTRTGYLVSDEFTLTRTP